MSERWDLVSKWMHSKTEVSDELTVKRVTEIMVEKKIGSVIVSSSKEGPGIITERDILVKVVMGCLDPVKTLVKDIVTKPLVTIDDDKTIWNASEVMSENHMRRLPVVNRAGDIIGILTTRSISDALPVISRFKESQELLTALKNMKHEE